MIIENNRMALRAISNACKISNYLNGRHNVLSRKDFEFGGNTFQTAKIVLQSIKSIVDYHSSFICGNQVSITGNQEIVSLLQAVYKKGHYNKTDFDVVKNIITYGNAYEYVYKDNNGIIKSKVLNNKECSPIYEDGEYIGFSEKWKNNELETEHELYYTADEVKEYRNGVLVDEYNNPTGLPIHYTSGNLDESNFFGLGIIDDLIPIMDQIEELLSKMSDSVTTLSLNPLGVSIGDRVDASIDKDITGATIFVESGGDFRWNTANLDTNAIKLLLDNLINQYFTIACVPSTLYGQGNIANVSETSLQILYSNTESLAKRISLNMLEGVYQRLEYISKLLGTDITGANVNFNFDKPIDYNNLMNNMKLLWEMNAISRQSIIRNSPYTSDVGQELILLECEQEKKNVVNTTNSEELNK